MEIALHEWRSELLTIKQAAEESGYTEEHLRRQAREGKLPVEPRNGKNGHVKVRRGNLRAKPGRHSAKGGNSGLDYDPLKLPPPPLEQLI